MLLEQVPRLQVDKLATKVSYTSSKNSVAVVFLNQECFFLSLYATFGVMFGHVSPQSLLFPLKGTHIYNLSESEMPKHKM